jgi:signal transduction histidine kinase
MSRLLAALSSAFQAYATWLVAITWKRFVVLSILALIIANVATNLPPFSWKIGESIPKAARVERHTGDFDVTIDDEGVRIKRKRKPAADAAPAESAKSEPAAEESIVADIKREVFDEIHAEIAKEMGGEFRPRRARAVRLGHPLPELTMLLIFVSAAIKIAYAGRVKAEAKAAEETLKRQVVEARMAAMQAQVEPHFLFNTLASIDHLIEVDPPRASTMQKNLIALLRAAMPAMREAQATLGRELQVVRPYLEILKMRMQERLRAEVAVPEGLQSADFPPMMLQSLVENAIKHGLEPKPEGGSLTVGAEVLHGKLAVTVADTGVGFGRAATAGTGTGLASIRERLKLIYGAEGELRIGENSPQGTRATIVVPYKTAIST